MLVVALLSSSHQGSPVQGDHWHAPWFPALAVRDNVCIICMSCMLPVLILVTRPSCVNLMNSIKGVGNSCSYLSYRRSIMCSWHYMYMYTHVVLKWGIKFLFTAHAAHVFSWFYQTTYYCYQSWVQASGSVLQAQAQALSDVLQHLFNYKFCLRWRVPFCPRS